MGRYIVLLAFALTLRAQSGDAVLTQTLIQEIRALRQQLEATNITSQRVQIALYRLQSQTAIVNIAEQRLDTARTRRVDSETQHRSMTAQIEQAEELLRNTAGDPAQRKDAADNLPRVKAALEAVAVEVAARRSAESDAESQLRAERARLADLQALLDRLDKALDDLARPTK